MTKVKRISPLLGCDPEFFFKSKGEVIGAEKVLPKGGLLRNGHENYKEATTQTRLIIDGVQAELNPAPKSCRALLAGEISAMFQTFQTTMKKSGKDVTADFSRTIEITKANLDDLDASSRQFGCAPSKSIYARAKTALNIKKVDAEEYRVRAAGGHIHIGHHGKSQFNSDNAHGKELAVHYAKLEHILTDAHEQQRVVQMLDIICGNTGVLLDRDPGNIERRKLYGLAGEYRTPKHGLEYRTLSNFWLTSYPLMSLMFGLARLAVELMADPKNSEEFYSAFTSSVTTKNIHDAINNNDLDLALDNFNAIQALLMEVTEADEHYALHTKNIAWFHHFVAQVNSKGLEHYFKHDPLTHWVRNLPSGEVSTYMGINDFLSSVVKPEMVAMDKASKVA